MVLYLFHGIWWFIHWFINEIAHKSLTVHCSECVEKTWTNPANPGLDTWDFSIIPQLGSNIVERSGTVLDIEMTWAVSFQRNLPMIAGPPETHSTPEQIDKHIDVEIKLIIFLFYLLRLNMFFFFFVNVSHLDSLCYIPCKISTLNPLWKKTMVFVSFWHNHASFIWSIIERL